jgi:N-acetyl-gamma-glutamyl-phosphate reductase
VPRLHNYATSATITPVHSSARIRAAVVGATGYIGMQCVALLARHPRVQLTRVLGRSHAGERYCDVVPGSDVELRISDALDADSSDVVMAALPHTVAAQHARDWLSRGAVVVDLSADFRMRDSGAYERWYQVAHPAPDLCVEAVYGLVELRRAELRSADLIAVPGCYPTAALLACVPALRSGLVETRIVVDAKSGVSGAGRSPSQGAHFAEANESVHAYAVEGHRHKPEMVEQMISLTGQNVALTFVPHLVPMTRGILVTAYLQRRGAADHETLLQEYAGFAADNPFVTLGATPPATKSVTGTNRVALHLAQQEGVTVVTGAIDNLFKGAAGQAVQAVNLRFGFDEHEGLERWPLWP